MSHPDEEGFEALLKPIQDLTRNWEFNLCLHLEEYITYIRQICGDNIPDMNFAQAAVLVQNSANIYGKKVDFLFTAALQLLDTLSQKHKEARRQDNQDGASGQTGPRRRKAAVCLDTDEFVPFDDICSDRSLTLDLEKEKEKTTGSKKQKIVLNAAIKVNAKEKSSCNVYNSDNEIMGKKEEFRLNWRICSGGTLNELFVINKGRFSLLEPVEFSVCENNKTLDGNCSNHSIDSGVDHQPAIEEDEEEPPFVSTSLFGIPANIERESENNPEKQLPKKHKKDALVDVSKIVWEPNEFTTNLLEKPTKKKKVSKIPPGLDDTKKRKNGHEDTIFSYTVSDEFFKKFKNSSFYRDIDFCIHSRAVFEQRRKLLTKHRAKYHAYMEKAVGSEDTEDFIGYHIPDNDSDNEPDFDGFDERLDDGHEAPDIDAPLPDRVLNSQSDEPAWKEDDPNNYDSAARKALDQYRLNKSNDGKKSDMSKRVEEWHKKILPKLESAEHRSSFDIHEYGTKVLNKFSEDIGCVKTFEEIAAGQPREEVARYFLATLMLANQYNVEISETQEGDLNEDCVQLKLLSIIRHHEELDDNLRHTSEK